MGRLNALSWLSYTLNKILDKVTQIIGRSWAELVVIGQKKFIVNVPQVTNINETRNKVLMFLGWTLRLGPKQFSDRVHFKMQKTAYLKIFL